MIIDSLIEKIKKTQNPACVGLDTDISYLHEDTVQKCKTVPDVCRAIEEFNFSIIDAVSDIVPAVKVQAAYYEIWGADGIKLMQDTLAYAKKKGLFTILDAKRNDIDATAAAYARAYLAGVEIGGKHQRAYECDMLTVTPYLGSDGLTPFVKECKAHDKGIFILCKTSNKSSGELQNLETKSGETIYQKAAKLISSQDTETGKYGYSRVGAVVGATYPEEAKHLRAIMPHTFFLVPGYGAQGGGAMSVAPAFDTKGLGAIVNNSRGILLAYKKDFVGLRPREAARAAAEKMQEDLSQISFY